MLVPERVCVLRHDQTIQANFYDCHKWWISNHKSLLNRKVDHSNFADIVLNTHQNIELFFSLHFFGPEPCQFSWDFPIMLKYSHPLNDTFLWNVNLGFVRRIFSDVDCQLRYGFPSRLYVKDSYPQCGTSENNTSFLMKIRSFTSCFVNVGSIVTIYCFFLHEVKFKCKKIICIFCRQTWGVYNILS